MAEDTTAGSRARSYVSISTTSDPDGGESISEGEVVDDQGCSTPEAAVSEGHAASLHVLARMIDTRAGTVAMIAHPIARATSTVDQLANRSQRAAFRKRLV